MLRSDSYWGQPAKIEEVIYRTIKEDAARIAALEGGQADLISTIPSHEVPRLKSNSRLRIAQVEGLRPIFLVLSPAYKPLDNPKVRRAISHAIDRDRLIKHVLEGNAYPLNGLIGRQVFGYDPGAKAYSYDPDKAIAALKEYGGNVIHTTLPIDIETRLKAAVSQPEARAGRVCSRSTR